MINNGKKLAGPLMMASLVAGCASGAERPRPSTAAVAEPAPAVIRSVVGLEAVVGRTAAFLTERLGPPDLDIREGTARKLQFASSVCVLDTYLYPPARGGEPIVTHVDARLPDGRDMDRASCVAAIERRQQAR